jgi:Beta-propeller repeat
MPFPFFLLYNMKKLSLLLCFLGAVVLSFAQNVTITPGGITPAMTGAYPRISYDAILALPNPAKGDMAFDMTFNCLRVYTGAKWICTYQSPSDPTPNLIALASAGGTSDDEGYGIAVDGSSNVYVTGYFQGTATFGTTTKTSAGLSDIFVAKYNSSGALQWVQSAGGTLGDGGRGIAVDASGNVYVTGWYRGTATFGTTTKTSAGDVDIFVAKYNSSGAFQWVQSAGGTLGDGGRGIAVDGSGSVYVTGLYEGTATFGTTTKTSAGGDDIFVAKYNSTGTLQWLQSAGGTLSDVGIDIAVDGSGSVYVTGLYEGTATFGTTTKTSAGASDIFVAKYNSVGVTWDWVQSAGGTSDDVGYGIAVDGSSNVYVTGYYQGTATFGTGIAIKISAGFSDIFMAKYNSSGAFRWVESEGSTSDDFGKGIAVDGSGNVYVTGIYGSTATFGTTTKTSAGFSDIFVAKYNSNGALQWVQSAGGTSFDEGYGIAVGGSGNVYVTGIYGSTATFGNNSLTSAGATDIFVARIHK